MELENKPKFFFAFDDKMKRRVLHVYKKGYLISTITGRKFKFDIDKHIENQKIITEKQKEHEKKQRYKLYLKLKKEFEK